VLRLSAKDLYPLELVGAVFGNKIVDAVCCNHHEPTVCMRVCVHVCVHVCVTTTNPSSAYPCTRVYIGF
jgi:hypothetical protein